MVEIFAGFAVLCSVSKQAGMTSSLAVDKIRKAGARSTIHQLDLTMHKDQTLLKEWVQSPLLARIHLAPVCGAASQARDIRPFDGDPQPLRSDLEPEGISNLTAKDGERVRLANELFAFSRELFSLASALGILATMENPRSSYFWVTCWVLPVLRTQKVWHCDFQMCMYGSKRDKWTRLLANLSTVTNLSICCDRSHTHEGWHFTTDPSGNRVWATAVESQYPRRVCIALVNVVLHFLQNQGLTLRADCIDDDLSNPLAIAQHSRIAAMTSLGQAKCHRSCLIFLQ
eukprot:s2538_g10.t1